MATGPAEAAIDDSLQKKEDKVKALVKELYDHQLKATHIDIDKKKANCWDFYDQVKPSHRRPDFKINFLTGRNDPETLKKELRLALVEEKKWEVSDNAERVVNTFVNKWWINAEQHVIMDCPIFAMEILKHLDAPQYMTERLIELSIAGQIRWETDDVDEESEGDITNFSGTVTYGERKLFEAGKLWRRVSSGDSKGVRNPRSLLPMIYWLKDVKDGPTWVEWNPYRKDSTPKNTDPPLWAVNYIKEAQAQGDILYSNMRRFHPNAKPYKHENAVYLLLCRFNGEGVPDEARVRAYAGKATNGVEERWKKHALASKNLMQLFSDLKKFSATPLQSVLLVDVLIGRLYAEGGRKYFTETGDVITSHDNIALFVYQAYGKDAAGVKTNKKTMEKTEKDLIKDLQLKKMECGMNGRS